MLATLKIRSSIGVSNAFIRGLGDGLMKIYWIVVNLWRTLRIKLSHLVKLSAWHNALELELRTFFTNWGISR